MSESMIERVARIIELAIMRHGVGEADLKNTLDDARDVIEAMREPTDEVVEVGAANIPPWWSEGMRGSRDFGNAKKAAKSAWNGMIDAALKEQP